MQQLIKCVSIAYSVKSQLSSLKHRKTGVIPDRQFVQYGKMLNLCVCSGVKVVYLFI